MIINYEHKNITEKRSATFTRKSKGTSKKSDYIRKANLKIQVIDTSNESY